MVALKPDAVLVLGDTNSCLSSSAQSGCTSPIFHMEAGNRCKDECLPEENEPPQSWTSFRTSICAIPNTPALSWRTAGCPRAHPM